MMKMNLASRVETQLRFSDPAERKKLLAAFTVLHMRSTSDFAHMFGSRNAKFHGLIITGKDMNLAPREQARLRWRLDKVMVDSNTISCVSFDELREDLRYWLN